MDKVKGMIDISDKQIVKRTAIATGFIKLNQESLTHIKNKTNPKGDVLENAKLAAIQGVKQTPNLIFMCHPLPIENIDVDFEIEQDGVRVTVTVTAHYKTGVEMEALTGVSMALLTLWDVSKRFEKDETGNYPTTKIGDIRVLAKRKE